jgi:hypothetical protein
MARVTFAPTVDVATAAVCRGPCATTTQSVESGLSAVIAVVW